MTIEGWPVESIESLRTELDKVKNERNQLREFAYKVIKLAEQDPSSGVVPGADLLDRSLDWIKDLIDKAWKYDGLCK